MEYVATRSITDLDVEYLKSRYLYGLDFVEDDGTPWPDAPYENAINVAIVKFQEMTQIAVTDAPITREIHDYSASDYVRWAFLGLFHKPVVSVQKIEVKFPVNDDFIEWPLDWVKLNRESGQIQLIPSQGSLSSILIGQNAGLLPLLQGAYNYVPQMWHISYTPGFPNAQIPLMIIDVICKLAAVELLTLASDTIYQPGVSSITVSKDGVSHALGILNNGRLPAVFASKIGFWLSQLYGDGRQWNGNDGEIGALLKKYRGINFVVA